MAVQTLKQRIALDGGKEIREELQALGAVGEAAFKKLQAAANATNQRGGFLSGLSTAAAGLRVNLGQLGTAAKDVGKSFGEFESALTASAKSVTIFAAAVGGAAFGIFKFFETSARSAREITEQAAALGVSTDKFQKYASIAKISGLDVEALIKIIQRFDVKVAESGDTAAAAAKPLSEWQKHIVLAPGATEQLLGTTDVIVRSIDATKKAAEATTKAVGGVGKGVKDTHDLLKGFGTTVKTIDDEIVIFARRLEQIPAGAARLKALVDVGAATARNAAATAIFFHNLAEGAIELVRPLDQVQLALGDKFDVALITLQENLRRTKNALATLFFGAGSEGLDKFNKLLIDNQDRILAFGASIRDKVVPIVKDLFNALSGHDADVQNRVFIDIRDALIEIGRGAKVAFDDVLVPALRLVRQLANDMAAGLNAIFGTKFSGDTLLAAAATLKLVGAFRLLVSAITLAITLAQNWRALGLLALAAVFLDFQKRVEDFKAQLQTQTDATSQQNFGKPFGQLTTQQFGQQVVKEELGGISKDVQDFVDHVNGLLETIGDLKVWQTLLDAGTAAVHGIRDLFVGLGQFIAGLWQQIGDGARALDTAIVGVFDAIGEGIKNAILGAVGFVKDQFNGLISFAQSIATTIGNIISSILGSLSSAKSKQDASGGPLLARGGQVFGPGTSTSDSIPARLSVGEFVLNARSVQRYGVDFIRALNAMRVPLGAFRGFSLGGLADGINQSLAIPRFAMGGLATAGPAAPSAMHTLNLTIGGETFRGLLAPEDTAASIMRFAAKRNLRRAGGRPSWAGS